MSRNVRVIAREGHRKKKGDPNNIALLLNVMNRAGWKIDFIFMSKISTKRGGKKLSLKFSTQISNSVAKNLKCKYFGQKLKYFELGNAAVVPHVSYSLGLHATILVYTLPMAMKCDGR